MRATINSPMDSPKKCVGGTQNPGFTGKAQITGFLRMVGVYCTPEVRVSV